MRELPWSQKVKAKDRRPGPQLGALTMGFLTTGFGGGGGKFFLTP